MKLSDRALKELKQILIKELGQESADEFDDKLLEDLGNRLLGVTKAVLKDKKDRL